METRWRIPFLSHSHLRAPNPIRNMAHARCVASYRRPNLRCMTYFLSLSGYLFSLPIPVSQAQPLHSRACKSECAPTCACARVQPSLQHRFDRNKGGGQRVSTTSGSEVDERPESEDELLTNLYPFSRMQAGSRAARSSSICCDASTSSMSLLGDATAS